MSPSGPVVILSIKPVYAEMILAGDKTVELRKHFSADLEGSLLALYVSAPTKALCGTARVAGVTVDSPERLWRRFGRNAGVTQGELIGYYNGRARGAAVSLTDVRRWAQPVPLRAMRTLPGGFVVHPSHYALDPNKPVARLIDGYPQSVEQMLSSFANRPPTRRLFDR